MQNITIYHIKLRGKVEAKAFVTTSPVHVRVAHAEQDATLLAANVDQSGLIGLLRYLHQQGYVLLCVTRAED
jgi:hypothetical protein